MITNLSIKPVKVHNNQFLPDILKKNHSLYGELLALIIQHTHTHVVFFYWNKEDNNKEPNKILLINRITVVIIFQQSTTHNIPYTRVT